MTSRAASLKYRLSATGHNSKHLRMYISDFAVFALQLAYNRREHCAKSMITILEQPAERFQDFSG